MLQWEHSAILSTCIKLPFVMKSFVLSIFEWPLKTGFTVINYEALSVKVPVRSTVLCLMGYYIILLSRKMPTYTRCRVFQHFDQHGTHNGALEPMMTYSKVTRL